VVFWRETHAASIMQLLILRPFSIDFNIRQCAHPEAPASIFARRLWMILFISAMCSKSLCIALS
jgi:hypothetical protein